MVWVSDKAYTTTLPNFPRRAGPSRPYLFRTSHVIYYIYCQFNIIGVFSGDISANSPYKFPIFANREKSTVRLYWESHLKSLWTYRSEKVGMDKNNMSTENSLFRDFSIVFFKRQLHRYRRYSSSSKEEHRVVHMLMLHTFQFTLRSVQSDLASSFIPYFLDNSDTIFRKKRLELL